MLKIIGETGSGKTKKLIEYVGEHGGIILCSNPTRMLEKARAYGYPEVRFMEFEEYFMEAKTDLTEDYYLDDIDTFLEYCFVNVKGFICNK